jgi:hypothetical protein
LVFCAYTFILYHQWTGGLRPRWGKKPLNTFTAALEGFRTAISFLFIDWFNLNPDVFPSYQIKPVWATFGLDFCLRPVNQLLGFKPSLCKCLAFSFSSPTKVLTFLVLPTFLPVVSSIKKGYFWTYHF